MLFEPITRSWELENVWRPPEPCNLSVLCMCRLSTVPPRLLLKTAEPPILVKGRDKFGPAGSTLVSSCNYAVELRLSNSRWDCRSVSEPLGPLGFEPLTPIFLMFVSSTPIYVIRVSGLPMLLISSSPFNERDGLKASSSSVGVWSEAMLSPLTLLRSNSDGCYRLILHSTVFGFIVATAESYFNDFLML